LLYSCLVLDAHRQLPAQAVTAFDHHGLLIHHASSIAAAQRVLAQWQFDAVVVDADGFADSLRGVLRLLQESATPAMVVSSEPDQALHLRWFEQGAIDVVSKEVSADLLALKLRRIVQTVNRPSPSDSESIDIGPLVLDPPYGRAWYGDVKIALTVKQYEVFHLLALRLGEFVTRETIAYALRRTVDGRGIDMLISKIRRELRKASASRIFINTVLGRGYCLTVEDAPSDLS
jgi:DNA-binding response OmpR family regulator